MSENSRISVVFPDALISVAAGKGLSAKERDSFAPAPAMARLMARGQWGPLKACEGDPLEQWLFGTLHAFASASGRGEPVLAEVRATSPDAARKQADCVPPPWAMVGAGDAAAFSRWFVSPVHVGIGREGVSLMPPDELGLSDEHAVTLNGLLCSVVEEHGWAPVPTGFEGSDRSPLWGCVLQTDSPLPQSLPSPWAVARQRFTDLLPGGAAMAAWRRMWMDVQMALHAHPVNAQRQAQGLPAVNAFWWWGGGAPLDADRVQLVCLRVHDLAQMADGSPASGCSDGARQGATNRGVSRSLTTQDMHRCAAWLGSCLAAPGRDGGAAATGGASDAEQLAIHLVENTNAGMWFGAGARHPAVLALDQQLLAPLAQAAAPHELVLLGQSGWRSAASSAALRLAFWKNRPDVDNLLEPVDGLLDEADLARAWQDSARRAVPDDGEFAPDRF